MLSAIAHKTAIREIVIVAVAMVFFSAVMLWSLEAARNLPALLIMPIVIALIMASAVVVMLASFGNAPAMMTVLFVLVFVNDALFRTREAGDIGLDWQNALKFTLWASVVMIALVRLRGRYRSVARAPHLLALAYIGFALISSLYSAAPVYSFATALGMLALLLFAIALTETLSEKQILLPFALSLWLFTLVGWVVFYQIPELGSSPFVTDLGIEQRICGIAGQANSLGRVLAVLLAVVFLLWYRGHARVLTVLPIAATGFVTLLASDSRTSLLAVLAGIAAVVLRRSGSRWGLALLTGTLASLLVMATPIHDIYRFFAGMSRSGDPTEVFTLTGRTEIWQFVWDKIELSPWLGYGYNSSKFILPLFRGLGLEVDEAHNMWLQTLLSVGVIGTVPLVLLVVMLIIDYIRAPSTPRDLFFFLMLVYGITVAGAFGTTPTVLTLVVFIGIAEAYRDPRQPRALRARTSSPIFAAG